MRNPWIALLLMALAAAPTSAGPPGHEPASLVPAAQVAHDPAAMSEPAPDPDSGAELIGTPAPAWSFTRWVRGGPYTLASLRGKVVLIRFWNENCHFCAATLPALEQLQKEHGDDGLVVIGVFHPKPPHAVSNAHVIAVAREIGFSGPLALDRDWKTLGRYWLDGHPDRSWTSVSFLIDREGVLRWVHGGGEYHPSDDPRHARCDAEYRGLEKAVAAALAKPAAGGVPSGSR
jgi:thiol-disulfide isomerase/thioredoxin